METSSASNSKHDQPGQARREPDVLPQTDEVLAWEPLGEDLWLPHRIRGSWRGGVLG
jgi:hypothetical protein